MNEPFKYTNLGVTAGTTIHNKPGFLHSVIINTPIASGTVTIYDNTAASGTKIATITLPATLLNEGPQFALYDVNFYTGLTIVTTGTNIDVTVSSTG